MNVTELSQRLEELAKEHPEAKVVHESGSFNGGLFVIKDIEVITVHHADGPEVQILLS